MSNLSFIYWLPFIAVPLLAVLLFAFVKRQRQSGKWRYEVDAHLLTAQTTGADKGNSYLPAILLGVAWLLTIIALAGPSFSKVKVPVIKPNDTQIIALDLSRSMDAQDIKPSRLSQARFKVLDLLNHTKGTRTGLLAFAATSHLVSPITNDQDTLEHLIPALNSKIMPQQGSNLSAPIKQATELLNNANLQTGDIIIVTDSKPGGEAIRAAKKAAKDGFHVHVLGVGTADGAPIPNEKGELIRHNGKVVVVRQHITEWKNLAKVGNGKFSKMTIGDSDIKALVPSPLSAKLAKNDDDESQDDTTIEGEVAQNAGFWLLLLILPLASLAFRKGWLLAVLISLPLLSPEATYADDVNDPGAYTSIWQNNSQAAERAYAEGNYKITEQLHDNPVWKGTAAFRNKDYQAALDHFSASETATADYNRGNTLAHMDKLEDALAAYKDAVKKDPAFDDIVASNREAIAREITRRKLEKQKNQQQPNKNDPKNDQGSNNKPNKEQDKQEGKDSKQGKGGKQRKKPEQDQQGKNGQQQNKPNKEQTGKPSSEKQGDDKQNAGNKKSDNAKKPNQKGQKPNADNKQPKDGKRDKPDSTNPSLSKAELAEEEKQRRLQQWLKNINNNPEILLQRKFARQKLEQSGSTTTGSGESW